MVSGRNPPSASVSTSYPGSSTSSPGPPTRVSPTLSGGLSGYGCWSPLRPPERWSSPGPPNRRSVPPSPQTRSSPPPPRTTSSPARPATTSSPAVPVSVSSPPVPVIVATAPRHVGAVLQTACEDPAKDPQDGCGTSSSAVNVAVTRSLVGMRCPCPIRPPRKQRPHRVSHRRPVSPQGWARETTDVQNWDGRGRL